MNLAGLSRPARSAGLALLAIAVIAAVIGGITLATGGGGEDLAGRSGNSPSGGGPPPGTATSSPGASTGPGTSSSKHPPTSDTPGNGKSSAPESGAPTSGSGEPGRGGTPGTGGANGEPNGGPRNADVAVRVYNNSKIANLATRAAKDLRDQGWTVAEVSNYPFGVVPATTAYYRKGTNEKSAALSLAAAFGMRAEPRFDGIKDASPGVIIIVTKDYTGPVGKSG